jgi:5-methyltetrahydropteroyltriglutamate--homocysteine methyltransferase
MVEAQLTGSFPRSEKLVEATRAVTRGKVPQAEVDAIFAQDLASLVDLQRSSSLDILVDGQLNWQDLFRPFSELFTGVQLGGLTRWFDNNTFYRKPNIIQKVIYKGTDLERYFKHELLPRNSRTKAILPGPFTFAALAQNSAYKSLADLTDDLAHALRQAANELQKLGYTDFQFNEPALTVDGRSKRDLEVAKHAFEVCAKGLAAHTTLQTYFGDAGPVIDDLLDYPVNCIGLDFYATSLESLDKHDFNLELACGCIDGRNSLLETPNALTRFVADANERLSPKSIILGPNCDLDFLPQKVAERKVHLLAETKKELGT